ncbi:hypothetical protein JZ751_022395 [Albula glossodonta]|uniref:Uncharacterized protein n=1 Tax=Albula glossodonta TaxID=121402 RepID=A0A8T2MQM9_9TELE|nr:hypothetical protein JZ751_022395 [Albula glossodonta]
MKENEPLRYPFPHSAAELRYQQSTVTLRGFGKVGRRGLFPQPGLRVALPESPLCAHPPPGPLQPHHWVFLVLPHQLKLVLEFGRWRDNGERSTQLPGLSAAWRTCDHA